MKKIGGFEKYNADHVHNFLLLIFTSSGHNACFHMDSTGEIYPVLFILCIIWCCKSLYDDLVWDKFFFFLAQESWPFIIGIIIIIILHVMWPETKCFVRIFFPFVFLWVGKKKGDTKKLDAFGYLRVFPRISSGFSWFIPHACALLNAHVYSKVLTQLISGFLGVISMLVLSLHKKLHLAFALFSLMAGSAGIAIADVTIDACVTQNSINHPSLASDMQSLCGLSSSIGALVGFSLSGVFVHLVGPKVTFCSIACSSSHPFWWHSLFCNSFSVWFYQILAYILICSAAKQWKWFDNLVIQFLLIWFLTNEIWR